ncbi:hypothetical protein CKAN_01599500 [Cinnamomum micranthum f. kanehirae]|uniref:Receptor-like serine/threonine-protein kinase n=1 Tax=Cinnamomum micranthum f. kanehirae TaxID=337451 RepID=A0A443P8E8_9MAGN|nr:hypothetical protein CKAN_01599500 [Cinnamomum micranthum f. kanehirae]
MAPIICILLFAFAFDLEIAQPTLPSKTISLDMSLYPNGNTSYWPSPSGHFAFGFYKEGQGFRVGIWLSNTSSTSNKSNKVVVWTANRDDHPVSANATLVLTYDGELVLKTEDGQAPLIKQLSEFIHHASMVDNGNFLLYSSHSKIIWQSFDYPTDTILGGQSVNSSLYSGMSGIDHSSGKFILDFGGYTLVLRHDSYPRDDFDIYWASRGYDDSGDFKLILDDHGHMYLVTEKGEIMENFMDGRPNFGKENLVIYRATLDSDGVFRLYSHCIQENGSFAKEVVKWKEPKDKCSVNGICGFNSYCKLEGDQTDCLCLPGFNYTNPSDRSAGCYMRPWGDRGLRSNITTLENTTFAVDSYSAESGDKEDCMEACRIDDLCMFALFSFNCYKLKFPLRYGRTNDQTISDVLFVKSASGNCSTENSTCSTSSSLFKISVILIGVGVTIAICSCITMAVVGYLISRRGLWKHTTSSEGKLDSTEDIVLRSFSYKELVAATNGFSEVLGRGHFGTVYKGSLTDRENERTVAVKKLEKVVEEGEREFHMEMRAIGRTHHKNLVRLVGFCNEGFNRLLVYDYMKNGSLADFLFGTERHPSLSDRMRIILEVARGILYLHEDCEPHIIHCDIKPHNILLDEFWTAKISDFGMAKLLMPNQTKTFTGPRGTRGYLAPEWYQNKPISVKADVYSFGIVLLETLFCRKNMELEVDDNEIILTDWIYKCHEAGELSKLLLDTEEVEKRQMERIIKVGLCCVQGEPDLRPTMKNVIWMIEGLMDVHVPPLPTS